ncbi:helix-turn-helix transcriptional regulator [Nocardiopsis lambiniae]|uniref:AAA family ATPase n=1 Tax=Nocardiopsis lambiniae TaxID=3075539 RepID=A0ABU2MAH7_9ACTN|nr:AAA family ATPase [Nocardiopsis sp. DSM 44743]MDT0329687.1 AAA family ATPase [Nocardiopsis sp. DSM 44743]
MTRVPPTVTAPSGRERELAAVRRLLHAARSGRSDALLVTGGPGSGKSALLAHAVTEAADLTVLYARAVPEESELAHAGLHQLLRTVLPYLPRLPAAQREVLDEALSLGRDDRPFPLAAAALALLTEAAAEHPLLVCVDDLHLMDRSSRQAIAFAARRFSVEGVATLLTADADVLGDLAGPARLALSPLPDRVLSDLLDERSPHPLAAGVRADLVAAARGNPRAAGELADALTPGQACGDAPLGEPPRSHGTLTDTCARLLRSLPADTRHRLLLMVLDETAEHHDRAEAAGLDPGDLEPAVAAGLVRHEAGRPVPAHPLVRTACYHRSPLGERHAAHRALADLYADLPAVAARHRAAAVAGTDPVLAAELTAIARNTTEHATAALLWERAAELTPTADAPSGSRSTGTVREAGSGAARPSGRAAEPVTTTDGTVREGRAPAIAEDRIGAKIREDRFLMAARHAWIAGDHRRARRDAHRAGDAADPFAAQMDLRAGVAIDAFHRLSAAAERLADHDPSRALELFHHAGEAGCLAGDHDRYFATAARARALAERADSPRDRVLLDYMAGKSAIFRGRHAQGVDALRRVQVAADHLGEPDVLVLGVISGLLCGDHIRTRALAGRAVLIARRTGAAALVPQALEFLTYAELWFGRLSLAEESATEGLRTALATGQENCAGHHRAALAFVAAIRGEEETCRGLAGAALATAEAHDVGLPAALASWALALLDLGAGRAREAAVRLRALTRSGPGRSHAAVRLLLTPHLVEAAVRGGLDTRVDAGVATLHAWAEATGNDTARALVARCRGLLADGDRAQEDLFRALELHTSGYCDFEQARTRLLLGTRLRRSRHPGSAREHLTEAREIFERLGAVPWAAQAAAELRAAGGAVSGAETRLSDLSPQQLRIARHVADGATNREVAARMFLSTRTVDHHLRNIYSKLGIRSRVELSRLIDRPAFADRSTCR